MLGGFGSITSPDSLEVPGHQAATTGAKATCQPAEEPGGRGAHPVGQETSQLRAQPVAGYCAGDQVLAATGGCPATGGHALLPLGAALQAELAAACCTPLVGGVTFDAGLTPDLDEALTGREEAEGQHQPQDRYEDLEIGRAHV